MLLKRALGDKKRLDELSEWELSEVLCELINIEEYSDESYLLTRKVIDKAYPKAIAEFYNDIIDYRYDKKNEIEIVNKYANGNYKNEMFCRTGEKPFWYIESRILIKRGYPTVKNVLLSMFLWFQDLNWPGALEIFELLSSVEKEVIIPHLEEVAMVAKKENDIGWLYWLREFMEKNRYKKEDFKNKYIYEVLKNSTDM